MPSLLHQFLKVAHDDWPKVLLGLVVPACQFGWKTWNESRVVSKKKKLQERIAALAEQRSAPFGNNPAEARLKSDLDAEYAQALKEYEAFCHAAQATAVAIAIAAAADAPASVSPPTASRESATALVGATTAVNDRNWVQRWFLLYAPKRPIAWIPHTLFFVFLTITIFGCIGLLSEPSDPEIWYGILGLAVFVAIMLLFRAWAVRLERGAPVTQEPPSPRRRWIATVILVTALTLEVFFVFGSMLDDHDEPSFSTLQMNLTQILGGSAFFLAVALLGWMWRRRLARSN